MHWREYLELFTEPIFTMGQTPVSVATLFQFIVFIAFVALLAGFTRRFLRMRFLTRTKLDVGLQYLISRIAGYIVMLLGILVSLQTVGVDVSSLTVLAGALGVGIGFGLQTVVNNFVSGLILMGERSIQIGDRVDVGDATGEVMRIGARSTSIRTNDNIVNIIPNSEFVSGRVVNWSHMGDRRVRMRIPFGVSYGSDPLQVRELIIEVAMENQNVLKEPPPNVVFKGFGDSSLDFELRAWTQTLTDRPGMFRSELYFAIWAKFKEHGIEIPFPQRDVHVKDPVSVRIEDR